MGASIAYFIPTENRARWVSGLVAGNNTFTHNLNIGFGEVSIRLVSNGEELSAKVLITPTTIVINTGTVARPGPYNIIFIGVK